MAATAIPGSAPAGVALPYLSISRCCLPGSSMPCVWQLSQVNIMAFETPHAVHVQTADEDGRRKAQERFLRLKAAYEVLRDPAARREYDAGRSAAAA